MNKIAFIFLLVMFSGFVIYEEVKKNEEIASLKKEIKTFWEIKEDREEAIDSILPDSLKEEIANLYTDFQVQRSKGLR